MRTLIVGSPVEYTVNGDRCGSTRPLALTVRLTHVVRVVLGRSLFWALTGPFVKLSSLLAVPHDCFTRMSYPRHTPGQVKAEIH